MKRWLLRLLDRYTNLYANAPDLWYKDSKLWHWLNQAKCHKCKKTYTYFRNDMCSDCFVDNLLGF